jgi:hypothetical protein
MGDLDMNLHHGYYDLTIGESSSQWFSLQSLISFVVKL